MRSTETSGSQVARKRDAGVPAGAPTSLELLDTRSFDDTSNVDLPYAVSAS